MSYAFSFDARYCSGCKACQAACKDKNNLPTGVLWRRVYEVSGGTWQQEGGAWTNNIFAYNLSIACNHCVHPKCAGVCPTNAYSIREDGIVVLDSSKCVGCGYCAWACPYAAPQYDYEAGYMSKCDFCFDNLDRGVPPACVAACPLRVLDHGAMESTTKALALWDTPPDAHPYPLPSFSHTEPRLAITPHPGMNRGEIKSIANMEEIRTRVSSNWDELPLMLFTLLTQLAVGSFWIMTLFFPFAGSHLFSFLLIGASLGVGTLASLAHLGTKKNAWRVVSNIRKSSLSKEILFTGLFCLGWLFTTLQSVVWHQDATVWITATSVLGIGLIYNMSQVYRFRAAPGWNTWRTNVSFMVSALVLGISVMAPLLGYEANVMGVQVQDSLWQTSGVALSILLIAQWAAMKDASAQHLAHIRVGLIVFGIVLSAAIIVLSHDYPIWVGSLIAPIVISEEALGRWLFYASRLGDTPQSIHQ